MACLRAIEGRREAHAAGSRDTATHMPIAGVQACPAPASALGCPAAPRRFHDPLPDLSDTRPLRPGADLPICSKKVCNLDPMALRSRRITSITRGPPVVAGRSRWTPYYPTDSQLQVYDIYIIRRVLWADHARDVNILIWTSRKSVDHGTNDRIMVHGDGTRADGRRSSHRASIDEIVGSRG